MKVLVNYMFLLINIASEYLKLFTSEQDYRYYAAPMKARVAALDSSEGQRHMRKLVARFLSDTSGAAAIEYGLSAAGPSLAIATLLQGIGMRIMLSSTPADPLLR